MFVGNTTLAGALVTGTACAVTLATAGPGCVLMVQGHVDEGRGSLGQAGLFLAATAALVAERMIESMVDDDLHVDGIRVHVGVSVGIATIDPATDTSTSVVDRADEALRRAKAAGKAQWSRI